MVDPVLLEQVVRLSPADRQELFEAAQVAVDPELAAVIDARGADAESTPGAGRTWRDFRDELGSQYGQ